MVDKKMDDKEANELRKVVNHYFNWKILYYGIYIGDILGKEPASPEQRAKNLTVFQPKWCEQWF